MIERLMIAGMALTGSVAVGVASLGAVAQMVFAAHLWAGTIQKAMAW